MHNTAEQPSSVDQLAAQLQANCGIVAFPSATNCLLCELPLESADAAEIVRQAAKHKLFLRTGEGIHPSLGPRTIRIAVKSAEMNQRTIEVLATVIRASCATADV